MNLLELVQAALILFLLALVLTIVVHALVVLPRRPRCPLCRSRLWYDRRTGCCHRCELRMRPAYGWIPPTKMIVDHDLHWTVSQGWHRERRVEPVGYECSGCWELDWGAVDQLVAGAPAHTHQQRGLERWAYDHEADAVATLITVNKGDDDA